MRRNLFKYLLAVTTLGWAYTFLTLTIQMSSYQQLASKMHSLKQDYATLKASGKPKQPKLDHPGAANQSSEANNQLRRAPESKHRNMKSVTNSTLNKLPLELLGDLSTTLMNVQNDVIEVQYFLNRRRKGWSSTEKSFMEDLVKHLWFQVKNSRNKLVKNFCHETLRKTSDDILREISKVKLSFQILLHFYPAWNLDRLQKKFLSVNFHA